MIRVSGSLGICLVAGSAFGDGIDGKIWIVVKILNLLCSEDLIKRLPQTVLRMTHTKTEQKENVPGFKLGPHDLFSSRYYPGGHFASLSIYANPCQVVQLRSPHVDDDQLCL